VTAVASEAAPAPRRTCCARCGRPQVVCVCSHVTPLPTRTRVMLLQHPREHRVGVGTARLAHLSLPASSLHVGLDFDGDSAVRGVLASDAPAYVLFPGDGAIDVAALPRARALTLIVLDGTWWQARKLLRLNPMLAALPRVAFTPQRLSDYRIRRQPAAHCVSTIEALAETLSALEPEAGPFDRLLDPFRAMVARQEWYAAEVRSQRHRQPVRARRPSRRDKLAARLVAARPATGESYAAVIAPRRALAPSTPRHIGLSAEQLHAGVSAADWRNGWDDFVRPGDLLVQWGRYYGGLAAREGLDLDDVGSELDLRPEVSQILKRHLGAVDECLTGLGLATPPPEFDGRGGRRLAALVAAVSALVRSPLPDPPLADGGRGPDQRGASLVRSPLPSAGEV
jgi:DTW domain-containing protein YfiP